MAPRTKKTDARDYWAEARTVIAAKPKAPLHELLDAVRSDVHLAWHVVILYLEGQRGE